MLLILLVFQYFAHTGHGGCVLIAFGSNDDREPRGMLTRRDLIKLTTTLRLHVAAAAVRAALGQRNGNLFIDTRWNEAARLLTVLLTGLTAWMLGFGF